MSLYDGLGLDDKEGGKKEAKPGIAGWGSSLKLLPSQKELQNKKASLLNLKKRQVTSVAPVVDLRGRGGGKGDRGDGELRFNMQTGRMERVDNPLPASPFIGVDASSSFLGVSDEYDPLRPNDYEHHCKEIKERKNRQKEDDRKKELQERERRRKERHREQGIEDEDSDDDSKRRKEEDNRATRGAAIAPPQSLMEQDSQVEGGQSEEYGGNMGMNLKGSVASKIMAKMGYKSGAGLGRKEQGMSMALMVEKTSKRGGKIIHERDLPKQSSEPAPPVPAAPAPVNTANLLKNPSKVVLLRNMVGPGEVDDDLEGETIEECMKYGKVTKCIIYEIPNVLEEEAVRIFLEFEKIDAAVKAIIDLNGRFFGGRMVRACFYNLDKFRRLDLADSVD